MADAGSKPLANPRHEDFAQARAKGLTADAAYVEAGFSRNRSNAARMNANPNIQARIAYIKGKAAERTVTTVEDIARQLDEDRGFARKNRQAAAAVSATMGKAKVLGLIVDRHVIGMKKIEDMNENELRALLGVLDAGKNGNGA